jgi:chromosomal replication initiator protein
VRLAEGEDAASLSPLFLYAKSGMGKTHLLQGIAARFSERNPGAKVRCISAEVFTNEFIASLKAGATEGFRRSYRKLALLCIDDVHFLANKEATQIELLHTIDAVGFDGARLALASDEHPRDIRRLSNALASRFMSGAVLQIEEPDPALRLMLAARLGQRRGLSLDDSAPRALADAPWRSVRELEGLITQLIAVARLMPGFVAADGRFDGASVRRALELAGTHPRPGGEPASGPRARRPVPMPLIQTEVARRLRVELADMAGNGRHRRVVLARSVVVHLARRLTTLSFPEIARAMGRPNHSSVITAHNRILGLMKSRAESLGENAAALSTRSDDGCALAALHAEIGPELASLTVKQLCERLEAEILRLADERQGRPS